MLQERIFTALHLPNFAARADGEYDDSTPEGLDCTCYFERDWEQVSDDAVCGGRWISQCNSSLFGVIVFNDDGTATPYTRDQAYDAFGVTWVHAVECADAERAGAE